MSAASDAVSELEGDKVKRLRARAPLGATLSPSHTATQSRSPNMTKADIPRSLTEATNFNPARTLPWGSFCGTTQGNPRGPGKQPGLDNWQGERRSTLRSERVRRIQSGRTNHRKDIQQGQFAAAVHVGGAPAHGRDRAEEHGQMEKHAREFRGKTELDIEAQFSRWQQANAGLVSNVKRHPIERLPPSV